MFAEVKKIYILNFSKKHNHKTVFLITKQTCVQYTDLTKALQMMLNTLPYKESLKNLIFIFKKFRPLFQSVKMA